MSKEIVSSNKLIPFLNEKYKVDLKFRKDVTIERKEVFINKVETIDEKDATVWCTISTQETDRTGDVVVAKGIDTSEFKKIPSVYKNHNYAEDSIGTCEEMIFKNDCIMAKIKFAPLSVQMVKDTWERVKAGTMRGISVGFDATSVFLKGCREFEEYCKALKMDVASYAKTRRIIDKWMLYEFSLVSVPANASCTTKAVDVPEIKSADPQENALPEKPEDEELDEVIEKNCLNGRALKTGFTKEKANAEQLAKGIAVEMEHTDDPSIAEKIALDHLSEIENYYDLLAKMEKDDESNGDGPEEHDESEKNIDVTDVLKDIEAIEKAEIKEEDMGELVEKELVLKPMKSEHRARQQDPGKYSKFRRKNDAGGAGIDFIYGITDAGKAEVQSIAADADKWTVEKFREWLKAHKFKTSIEPAKGKSIDVPQKKANDYYKNSN